MAEAFAPIQITLYGTDNEEKKTYTRSIVPWGILKKAIRLWKIIGTDPNKVEEKDIDAIAGLVVELFGNQFSVEDLDQGAEVSEMLAVIQAIVTRGSTIVRANPTLPPA